MVRRLPPTTTQWSQDTAPLADSRISWSASTELEAAVCSRRSSRLPPST